MKAIAAGALAAVLLAGCGGGSGDQAADVPAPAVTTTVARGCAALATPAPTVDATTATGDFDGDGRPDRLLTGRTAAAGPWRVRMELAAGGGAETELPAGADGVKGIGAAVVDTGPAQAAFAVVGRDTAGTHVGLFVLRACKAERVTLGGQPADFPVGTASTFRSGLACQVPGLVAYQATTTDGSSFQASTLTYLVLGNFLDQAHRAASTLDAADPALTPYGRFTCGSLAL